jgi:hypothetical protein
MSDPLRAIYKRAGCSLDHFLTKLKSNLTGKNIKKFVVVPMDVQGRGKAFGAHEFHG